MANWKPGDTDLRDNLVPGIHPSGGGRDQIGTVAGIMSERWPPSNRNTWPPWIGIRSQYGEQIQQYATQLQQYANQVQNTVAIPSQIYSNAMADMQAVQNLMTQGTQLSFSNPGASMGTFSSFLGSTSGQLGNLSAQATQYQTWSQQSKDGITAAMQAIQNAAEISAQQVRETEKLRQLIMVQTQLAANQQSVASQQQSSGEAQWQNFLGTQVQPTSGSTYK
jgi:conjugal transfer/entry exclusion protein